MINLYTAATPNGYKPVILLEELAIPYTLHLIQLRDGEQFKPDYIAINPNSKIPAMTDQDTGITVFESGAILVYLAELAGQLIPTEPAARMAVLQWLIFQVANIGPMFGQLGHFVNSAPEPVPYAMQRYEMEAKRLLGVLNHQLAKGSYLAGAYSIADIATFPWVAVFEDLELDLDDYPNVSRWLQQMWERPAVKQGMSILT